MRKRKNEKIKIAEAITATLFGLTWGLLLGYFALEIIIKILIISSIWTN